MFWACVGMGPLKGKDPSNKFDGAAAGRYGRYSELFTTSHDRRTSTREFRNQLVPSQVADPANNIKGNQSGVKAGSFYGRAPLESSKEPSARVRAT